jgi:signal transduction histidine kinase
MVHLQQIVEMLLFLARADSEAKLPNLETVDLAAWLPEYLQSWSEHPRWFDLQIENRAGTFPVSVQTPLLGQLLNNLLENACKYSQPGTPIALHLETDSAYVTCVVTDHGCGIAPEDLAHVFEPFYRSGHVRKQGVAGIGLGLAIAQRIARSFDGSLGVDSQPGLGSRFTLRLPMTQHSAPASVACHAAAASPE